METDQLMPFDCLLEISRFLPLKFKVRLARTCKRLASSLLKPEYFLGFEMFKIEVFNNTERSKFRLIPGKDTETELLFLAKNCVLQEFKIHYNPFVVSTIVKHHLLEFFAYKCTAEKADMVLAMITSSHLNYTAKDNIRIVCTPNQSTELINEGTPETHVLDHDFELSNFLQLDLSKDNSLVFRKWLKAWIFKSKAEFVLSCSKAPPLSDLDLDDNDDTEIEFDFLSVPTSGEEQRYKFTSDFEHNPLLLQVRFNYASSSGDIKTCSQIISHPLISIMGLSPFLFRAALESGREPIINLFTNNHKFRRLILPFFIKNSASFYSDPTLKISEMIKSGRFDVHLADNHCLHLAAFSNLNGVVDILLQDPMVMSSRNWPASPLRILYDSGQFQKLKTLLSNKIPSTGIEKSLFRKSIQHGHGDLVRIFLQDKEDSRFDPCLGNSFKLVRFSVKYPCILEDLLFDPRSSHFPIMELVPQFPRVFWGLNVLEIVTRFVEKMGTDKLYNYHSLVKIGGALGNLDLLKKLTSKIDIPSDILSQTLDAACFNGHENVVDYLLTKVNPKPHHVVTSAKMGHSSLLLRLLRDERLCSFEISAINTTHFDEKVQRILYGFENKKWAEKFNRVMEKVLQIDMKAAAA